MIISGCIQITFRLCSCDLIVSYLLILHDCGIIHANNRTTMPVPLYIKDYQSLYELIIHLPPVSPVQAVYLHVLHSNLPARRFYEKRGFICLHTRPGCYTIDGKPADGCTYVLHTNGGYLDVKSTYPFFFQKLLFIVKYYFLLVSNTAPFLDIFC
ncbi:unnamed protein product [Trichobilharzia regenti]|nr:unnamed protein product [Trichobilharzia regenti]